MKHLLPALVVAAAAAATAAPAAAPQPRVAVYDLEGVLAESGNAQPGLFGGLRIEAGRPLTLAELTRSLARAAGDPAVAAVVVEADGADLDLAQVQEVRRRLEHVIKTFQAKAAATAPIAVDFSKMPSQVINEAAHGYE